MLKTGIKGHMELTVTEDITAKTMGSGELEVFATPAMLALMEKTAQTSVAEYLEEGSGTVGIKADLSHIAASPLGMKIYCDSELVQIDGRKLTFQIEARDDVEVIGTAVHERFIVDNVRFQEKANRKNAQ